MSRLTRFLSGCAIVLAACIPALGVGAFASPAGATGNTEWVAAGATYAGGGTSCTHPGYNTISAALAVAPVGGVVKVCSGVYAEQDLVTQSVTIQGLGGATLELPPSPQSSSSSCLASAVGPGLSYQVVLEVCAPSSTVTVSGLTIEGTWPASVCDDALYDVYVGAGTLKLSNSSVEGAGGNALTDGCQGGVGIRAGSNALGLTGHVTLSGDTVNTYQKAGVVVDGPGSTTAISNTSVAGVGATSAIAQNGIQISRGATGTVTSTTVTGNECSVAGVCGPNGWTDTQSDGILLYESGAVTVSNSTLSGNDTGFYNAQDQATLPSPSKTTITRSTLANRYENAQLDEGTSAISSDTLTGGEAGIQVYQYDGQVRPATVTATGDTITGTTPIAGSGIDASAVQVLSDQTAGDLPVAVSVTKSSLDTSNSHGVENQTSGPVTATDDWWGDGTGPSVWSFGSGSSVDPEVNFFPWALTSADNTYQACTAKAVNATSAVNDAVVCSLGAGNDHLSYTGTGSALVLGNAGNDVLLGSATGTTYMIGGAGSNVFNGNNGTGAIQSRSATDTCVNDANDMVFGSC